MAKVAKQKKEVTMEEALWKSGDGCHFVCTDGMVCLAVSHNQPCEFFALLSQACFKYCNCFIRPTLNILK